MSHLWRKAGRNQFFVVSAHNDLEARFECGILQVKAPEEIPKIRAAVLENLQKHWRLPAGTLDRMAQQSTFTDAYRVLRSAAPNIAPGSLLIDKFPDYSENILELLRRYDVPILFITRDPRGLVWSKHKRPFRNAGFTMGDATYCDDLSDIKIDVDRYLDAAGRRYRNAISAQKEFRDRLMILRLEEMIDDFEGERAKIFRFLNLDVPEELFGKTNVSKQKVRVGVDASAKEDNIKHMSEEVQNYILQRYHSAARTN